MLLMIISMLWTLVEMDTGGKMTTMADNNTTVLKLYDYISILFIANCSKFRKNDNHKAKITQNLDPAKLDKS
jgi:hypothetical protein